MLKRLYSLRLGEALLGYPTDNYYQFVDKFTRARTTGIGIGGIGILALVYTALILYVIKQHILIQHLYHFLFP